VRDSGDGPNMAQLSAAKTERWGTLQWSMRHERYPVHREETSTRLAENSDPSSSRIWIKMAALLVAACRLNQESVNPVGK
jgi:hypothetical protein